MSALQFNNSYRQIIALALPMSVSFLIPQLSLCFNTIFQSHLGLKELGDAGIVGVFYLVFAVVGYGLSTGLQTHLAFGAGANDGEYIKNYFVNGAFLGLAVALVTLVFSFTLVPSIITYTLGNTASSASIILFIKIRILGLPFLFGFQTIGTLLTATNRTKWLPVGTSVEAASNIILDYLLIFGKWGFPNLGFLGAAYASIIAEVLAFSTMCIIISKTDIGHYFKFNYKRIKKAILKSIFWRSLPLVLQHGISVVSFWIFFLLLKRNCDEQSAALTQPIRIIFGFFGISLWALGSATNAFTSNFLGQGKKHEIPSVVRKILVVSVSVTVMSVCILLLCSNSLFALFDHGVELHQYAYKVLLIIAVVLLFMSVGLVYFNALIGMGFVKQTFIFEVIAAGLYLIYVFVVIEVLQLGYNIAWLGEFVYWSVIFGTSFAFFYRKKKMLTS